MAESFQACFSGESLDYVSLMISLIFFLFREEIVTYYKLKKNFDIEEFCKVYPESAMFCDLLMYAKGLKFEEKPDYEKMRRQLNGLYQNIKE